MSFANTNTPKGNPEIKGKTVRFQPNNQGTGTRGVPSGAALYSRRYALAAVANPDAEGAENPLGTHKPDPRSTPPNYLPGKGLQKKKLPATNNPDGVAERPNQSRRASPRVSGM
jgi:hypothetical protein